MLKHILLGTLMIFTAGLFSQTQAQRGGSEQFILKYGEEIGLTDAQKEQILALASERRSEMRDRAQDRNTRERGMSRGNEQGNRDRMQNQRMENMMEFRSDFLEILTDEQKAELMQIRVAEIDERTELMQLRHRMMVEQAGIDGEKARSVLAIMNRNAAAMAEMQKNRIMGGDEMTPENMQAHRELMTQAQEEIKNLLTAAEYEKLQEQMRSNRPAGMRMMMNRRSR
jgi:hypothetical protein